MPSSPERTPQERETLIFPTPEEAQSWREHVQDKLARPGVKDVDGSREVVGAEVAAQFAAHGEGATWLREPWEHSPAEHEEAQKLVDVAFAHDLSAALKIAKRSVYYPRNLDLLHDLLTGELYEHVRQNKVNQQPLLLWFTEVAVIVLIAALAVLLLVVAIV